MSNAGSHGTTAGSLLTNTGSPVITAGSLVTTAGGPVTTAGSLVPTACADSLRYVVPQYGFSFFSAILLFCTKHAYLSLLLKFESLLGFGISSKSEIIIRSLS